jgi:uncharacterized protein YpbB
MIPEDVLIFFDPLQGRRPKVIVSLLTGKMTVSALFWGLDYQLLDWINLWKLVDGDAFLNVVDQAIQAKYLIKQNNQLFLTEQGQLKKADLTLPSKITGRLKLDEAMDLILLANQVISEYSFGNRRYIPVNDDQPINYGVKRWFKQLKQINSTPAAITEMYVKALTQIVQGLAGHDADLLVNYLPNHLDSGMTISQLADYDEVSKFQMELKLRIIFTKVIEQIFKNQIEPFNDLLKICLKSSVLPESTIQTWQAIQQGYQLKQIAHLRRIKENTVREHVLMIAILNDDFPYAAFTKFNLELTGNPADWNFSEVYEANPTLTYFDFRLLQIRRIKELQNGNDN